MDKVKARLIAWNGQIKEEEIDREIMHDVANAVSGQYLIVDKQKGFRFDGSLFKQVDIYEA